MAEKKSPPSADGKRSLIEPEHAELSVRRAVTQTDHHHLLRLHRGDNQRQVLVLLVEGVKKRQLLRPVRRIIHRVEVEGQRQRGLRERGNELIHEHVAESFQRGDGDLVLEA